MKEIYYLHSSLIPSESANAVQVLNMCSSLQDHQISVRLFCYQGQSADVNIKEFYGMSADIEIVCLKFRGFPWSLDLLFACAFREIFYKRERATYYTRNIAISFCCFLLGKRVILELHQPVSNRKDRFMLNYLFKKKSFSVIYISEGLKRMCHSITSNNRCKSIVLHDGFNSNLVSSNMSITRPSHLSKYSRIICYSGSLKPGRGVELIVEGAAHFPDDLFIVIGGSRDEVNFYGRSATENVLFLGHISQKEVYYYLSFSDILIALYDQNIGISGKETAEVSKYCSPLKLFEYMAFGKIIVTVKYDVFEELFDDDDVFFIEYSLEELVLILSAIKVNFENLNFMRINIAKKSEQYSYHSRASKVIEFIC
jgi:glycosyltransferase involved in cell wall biosynthesis